MVTESVAVPVVRSDGAGCETFGFVAIRLVDGTGDAAGGVGGSDSVLAAFAAARCGQLSGVESMLNVLDQPFGLVDLEQSAQRRGVTVRVGCDGRAHFSHVVGCEDLESVSVVGHLRCHSARTGIWVLRPCKRFLMVCDVEAKVKVTKSVRHVKRQALVS